MRGALLALVVLLAVPAGAWAAPRKYTNAYDEYFRKYSKHYFGVGFDWRWFKAQAVAESGLDAKAESWCSAKGIMQLMPSTFEEIRRAKPDLADIMDPRWNIAAGIHYDHLLWRTWSTVDPTTDRLSFTFGSYNAGPGTLRKARDVARGKGHDENRWDSIIQVAGEVPRWREEETLAYVRKIVELMAVVDR